ncbi:hypothetical protein ACFQ3K_07140 [Brucella gallinifaecis]|uniref:Uncharacterized protein n=1 Tax=Brucella gallinifaecis TaxID=215590 RepID=A0A502BKF0_9HYPH|nr:hypothetical protein [Brucella gallinifaecis]TPF74307.1 hypothetical protein FHY56_15260 [Brucella gallinifaecis]
MESFERAIRNALAKSDAHNPATRQRIYEAAWSAHERAFASNTTLSEEQKNQRREKVKEAISRIEAEFTTAQVEGSRIDPSLSSDLAPGDDSLESIPALDPTDIRIAASKRQASTNHGYETTVSRKPVKKKRRSPLLRIGLPVLIIAILGLIVFSLYNSFSNFTRSSGSSPLLSENSMAPIKEGDDPEGRRWINIFTPANATQLSVQGRATAEIQREGSNSFVRVQTAGVEDSVTFDVGEGVLNQLAGKKATFDIVARSDDGKTTQMTVICDFAGLGDCGRRRYDVRDSVSDFLFDQEFPAGQSAGRAGKIIINSDLSGSGKPVDIYAIRVTIAVEK